MLVIFLLCDKNDSFLIVNRKRERVVKMWAKLKSVHGFFNGDLKSALQKAVRRHDQSLFMMVGFELFFSKPCSVNAGWKRLNVIVEEDIGKSGLVEEVESLKKMAQKARKNGDDKKVMEIWRQVMFILFSVKQHRSNAWLARIYSEWCKKRIDEEGKALLEHWLEGKYSCQSIIQEMWRLQENGQVKIQQAEDILHLAQVACDNLGKSFPYKGAEISVYDGLEVDNGEKGIEAWISWWKKNGPMYKLPDYVYDHHTSVGRKKGRGLDHFLSEGIWLASPVNEEATWMKECRTVALDLYYSSRVRTRDLLRYVCWKKRGNATSAVRGTKETEAPMKKMVKTTKKDEDDITKDNELIEKGLGWTGNLPDDCQWIMAQRPCGKKPPTFLVFSKGRPNNGFWVKYDGGSGSINTIPLEAEQQKKDLNLPFLSMYRYGEYLIAPSLLRMDEIDTSGVFNGFPMIQKGVGKNRLFQLNYKLADGNEGERKQILRQVLPLQLFARVHGYSDAQHNNYVVIYDNTSSGYKVYMVDHMTVIEKEALNGSLEALKGVLDGRKEKAEEEEEEKEVERRYRKKDVQESVMRVLYGRRPPPKAYWDQIMKVLKEWTEEESGAGEENNKRPSWAIYWQRIKDQAKFPGDAEKMDELQMYLGIAADQYTCAA
jgi:hypothetical protein